MSRSALFLLVCGLSLVLAAGSAKAARITVTIDGLRNARGEVLVALYSKPDAFPDGDHSDQHLKVRASIQPITVVFNGLKPGTYAVGAYHDENGNGKLDTNFIGYPIEGYALSNGIRAVISRPTFAAASFKIGHGDNEVALHIKY